MSLCQVHWSSQALGKQTTTSILLPDTGTPPFATFYLLHGLSDDHSMWLRRTRIEMYVAGLPLIVVMPDGGRGFYTDQAKGPKYATHIGEELPDFIERTFPAKPAREARCIGGLSMGGYGAMRVGLGFSHRFASVNSHSGALLAGAAGYDIPERLQVFSDPAGNDLIQLAQTAKAAGTLPKIRIDCGVDDFLIEANRSMHKQLSELAINHEYQEFPGVHDWNYWDLHIRGAIAFHGKAMGF